MTKDAVVSAVQEIMANELHVDASRTDIDLIEGESLDSLDFVRLLAALETKYDIVIDLDGLDITDIRTVESLADLVMARL